MLNEKMTAEQIRNYSLEVMELELGDSGMTRFLQMFETGHGDYTAERRQWLDHLSLDEIYSSIQIKRQETE